jgi:hypothetical protein
MNFTKFTLWGLLWGWMCCTSCSLYACSFSVLCTSCTILFGICNWWLMCRTEFQAAVKCYPNVLSGVLWCAWLIWWMFFLEIHSFLELLIQLTDTLIWWSIFLLHQPQVSPNSNHRFWFPLPQHALHLFLRWCHDWMTPALMQSNLLWWGATISLEFFTKTWDRVCTKFLKCANSD